MKIAKMINTLCCGLVLLALLTTRVHAEASKQNGNGHVFLQGRDIAEFVTIVREKNGDISLIVTDEFNSTQRYHTYANVTSLTLSLGDGDDTVTISGHVLIDGDLTVHFSDGNSLFQSRPTYSDSLSVAGDFILTAGEMGTNEFEFSNQGDAISVRGDMELDTGTSGIAGIRIGNCTVEGDCTIQTGGGIDSVILGINQNGSSQIDGISTGGNLTIHTGKHGHTDFVVGHFCSIGGALSVTSGDGEDQVNFSNTDVMGKTTIKAGRHGDLIGFNNSNLYGDVLVDAGVGDDTVNIGGSRFVRATKFILKNGDDHLFLVNSIFELTTLVNGGNDFDTGMEINSTFEGGLLGVFMEDANF